MLVMKAARRGPSLLRVWDGDSFTSQSFGTRSALPKCSSQALLWCLEGSGSKALDLLSFGIFAFSFHSDICEHDP